MTIFYVIRNGCASQISTTSRPSPNSHSFHDQATVLCFKVQSKALGRVTAWSALISVVSYNEAIRCELVLGDICSSFLPFSNSQDTNAILCNQIYIKSEAGKIDTPRRL